MKAECSSCKRKWFLDDGSFIKKNKGGILMLLLLLAGLLLPGQKEQPELQGKTFPAITNHLKSISTDGKSIATIHE